MAWPALSFYLGGPVRPASGPPSIRGAVPEVGIRRVTLAQAGLRDPVLSALLASELLTPWLQRTRGAPAERDLRGSGLSEGDSAPHR